MSKGRIYTADEVALFARHVAARADHRPQGCDNGELCWVTLGPPAIDTTGGYTRCLGCHASLMNERRGPTKHRPVYARP